MRLAVAEDSAALAVDVAAHVADVAREAIATRGRFVVAFSGGGTPAAMLTELAGHDLLWSAVLVFQVDERVAPDGHPDRNLTALRERLVGEAPIPWENVQAMPVTDDDLEAAADRYGAALRAACGAPPVLDLVHLGLGDDGHTASLVPGDPVLDVTDRDVAVTETYRGRRRMTLTFPPLARARELLWLVEGSEKAGALQRMLDGDRTIPAGRLPQDHALVFTDRATRGAGSS